MKIYKFALIIFLLISFLIITACESPTAPKETRTDDTTIIRNDGTRKWWQDLRS